MQISNKTINNAINRKFIRPLKDGCVYNVSKFENERRTKHHETISLLKQAHTTGDYTDFVKLVNELEIEMLNKYLELL